jgi:hypothetical protein
MIQKHPLNNQVQEAGLQQVKRPKREFVQSAAIECEDFQIAVSKNEVEYMKQKIKGYQT